MGVILGRFGRKMGPFWREEVISNCIWINSSTHGANLGDPLAAYPRYNPGRVLWSLGEGTVVVLGVIWGDIGKKIGPARFCEEMEI